MDDVPTSGLAIDRADPPSQATRPMAPPRSTTSSKRRKRSGDDSSISERSSNGFVRAEREYVERINDGSQCWHCNAEGSGTDKCHVIGRRQVKARRPGSTSVGS